MWRQTNTAPKFMKFKKSCLKWLLNRLSTPCWQKRQETWREKYDKYWRDCLNINGALLLAVVLNPSYKIRYLRHCYSVLHGEDTCNAKTRVVEGHSRKLFKEYKELHFGVKPNEDILTRPHERQTRPPPSRKRKTHLAYVQRRISDDGGMPKNEVDRYLNETHEDISNDLDVLG